MAGMVNAQNDNLVNMSAEWMRSPARNAATDAGDIAIYNPSGLVRMSNGFHVNIGNQSMFRHPSHTYDMGMGAGSQTRTQDGSDPFLPNLYATYKKDRMAIFTGICITGGGATMNYTSGSITTDLIGLQGIMASQGAYTEAADQHLKASSFYLTSMLGISMAVTDRLSFAASGRFLDATNKTQAGMTFTSSPFDMPDAPYTLKTEDRASGFGGMISMMMKATPKMDITMRYETAVKLNFKTKQMHDDFGVTTDGEKTRRDLPATLAMGMAFSPNTTWKMYADVNYYFQENANWGTTMVSTGDKDVAFMAGDAMCYGMAVSCQASEKWMLSCGAGYADFMYNDRTGYYSKMGTMEVMPDDNMNVNCGFSCRMTPMLTMTCGYMHVFYPEQKMKAEMAQPLDVDVTVKNKIDAFAIGLNMQF